MSLAQHLLHLEGSGLIRPARTEPELEYLFRHTLVRDAVYDSLLDQDRRRLHGLIGQAIEQLYPQREDLAAVLAHHFYRADDEPRALRYFVLAGDVAFRRYAVAEAAAHYSRAVEIIRRRGAGDEIALPRVYTHLARALEMDAQYERALETCAEMEALAQARQDRAMELAAVLGRAQIYSTPNVACDIAQGQALANRALAMARELGDRPAEARIYWIMLLARRLDNDLDQALKYGEQSLELARELGLREQMAFTLQDLHRIYGQLGQTHLALAALEQARQLWRELGNLPLLADNLASTADQLCAIGQDDQAWEYAAEALQLSQAIGNLWNQAFSLDMMGEIYLGQGLVSRGLEHIRQAFQLANQAGLAILSARACYNLVGIYFQLGAASCCYDAIGQMRARLDRPGFSSYAVPVAAFVARLRLRAGDVAAAEEELSQALQWPGAHESVNLIFAQIELALARRDYARSNALARDLAARARELRASLLVSQMLDVSGEALLEAGEVEAARMVLRDAHAEFSKKRDDVFWCRTLAALAQAEAGCGQAEAAADFRQQARQIAERIAASIDEPDLRAAYLDLPHVRAVLESE